jgi:hypothetical protein
MAMPRLEAVRLSNEITKNLKTKNFPTYSTQICNAVLTSLLIKTLG